MPHTHKARKVSGVRKPPTPSSGRRDLAHAVMQNERDDDERAILALGPYCRVEVPPSGPIDPAVVEHTYEEVDCPPAYDDPAWDNCRTTMFREPTGCFCTAERDGDLPTIVDCPAR